MKSLSPTGATRPNFSRWQRLLAVLRLTHLFPTFMVLTATVIFGFLAAKGQPDPLKLLIVWLVVFCGHSAIGIANDYLDREQDALTQLYKPIPSGLVNPGFARNLLIGLLSAGGLISLALPLPAALLALACTASGLMYDFFLKDSYLSWVPYLVSFSSFPLFVWAGMGQFQPNLLWLYPPAVFLVIGINLANSLPDIEEDLAAHKLKGLPHLLGLKRTLALTWFLFLGAPSLCLVLSIFIPVNRLVAWTACGLAFLAVFISFGAFKLQKGRKALLLVWQLSTFSTLFTAIGWLGALTLK